MKDINNIKDLKEKIDMKDIKNMKDLKDIKEIKDRKGRKDKNGIKGLKEPKPLKELKPMKESKPMKEPKPLKESRPMKELNSMKELKSRERLKSRKELKSRKDLKCIKDLNYKKDLKYIKELKHKKELKENLCVTYNADNNYAKYLGISMLSLFETNKDFKEIDVYIMDCGISDTNKEKLLGIGDEYGRKIFFVSMKDFISGLKLNMGPKKIAIAAYARLFISSVIPDKYDKVLYLDCDTIILDNQSSLWKTDLKDFFAAGVRDTVERYAVTRIGLTKRDLYVNAGVLLVNLSAWRKHNIQKAFLDFIEKFGGNVPFHDQGIINGVCGKRIFALSPRYNVTSNMFTFTSDSIRKIYYMDSYYSEKKLTEARKNPAILHFTTGLVGRPWEENCTHPKKDEFIKAAEKSPWKDDPLLPDSRRFTLKAFTFLYRHAPLFISENIYRIGNRFKEFVYD